jgi:hypothetical protein
VSVEMMKCKPPHRALDQVDELLVVPRRAPFLDHLLERLERLAPIAQQLLRL